ncbi:MAG: hypothetical protein ACR2JC_14665 [Chloroflexota bacterium]
MPASTDMRILRALQRRRTRATRLVHRISPAALGSGLAAVIVALSVNLSVMSHAGSHANGLPSSALSPAIRQQAAQLQRDRIESAILGVRIAPQDNAAGRHQALLSVE